MENFDLIFDNGGGITLQTAGYVHHYSDPKQAAQDVSEILSGEDPAGWDGNEPDHRLEYDNDMERNGGYHWVTDNEVLEAVGLLDFEARGEYLDKIPGAAEREFFLCLFELRDKAALQQ